MMAIWYLCLLYFVTHSKIYAIVVTTEQGQLAGTFYELPNGRKVHAFYGIPYAEPPIHEYRFQVKPFISKISFFFFFCITHKI